MTRRRIHRDPVIWLIFAVAVAVPSFELARLRRARHASHPAPAPPTSAKQAGHPQAAPLAPIPAPPPAPPRGWTPAAPGDSTRATPTDSARTAPMDPSRYVPVGPTRTPIAASVLSPKGDLAAVLEESGRVTVWNVELHAQISSFPSGLPPSIASRRPPAMALTPAPDGETPANPPFLAIGGSDGRVRTWNAASGAKLLTASHGVKDPARGRASDLPIVDVAWSSPFVTSVTSDGTIAVWHAGMPADSALISTPQGPGGDATDVDINLDNEVIAVGSAGGLHLQKTADGTWMLVDTASGIHPEKVLFSPDGGLLASAWSDGEIRVYPTPVVRRWNDKGQRVYVTAAPTRIRTMRFPETSAPWLLAFNRDGTLLAASATGRTVYVWSMTPGTAPVALTVPREPVRSMWFAPQGRTLVVAGRGDRYLRELTLPANW